MPDIRRNYHRLTGLLASVVKRSLDPVYVIGLAMNTFGRYDFRHRRITGYLSAPLAECFHAIELL